MVPVLDRLDSPGREKTPTPGPGGSGLMDLVPQDLVNFGRSLTGGVQGALYGFQGVDRPYSTFPSPTTQPGINDNYKYIDNSHANIKDIHLNAGKSVAAF